MYNYLVFFTLLIIPSANLFTTNEPKAIAMASILLAGGLFFAYVNAKFDKEEIKKLVDRFF